MNRSTKDSGQPRFRSIQTKISLSALGIVFALVTLISLILLGNFKSMLRDKIFEQQFNLVTELAEQVNSRLQMAHIQLYMTAARINPANLHDKSSMNRLLDDKEDVKFVFDAGLLILDSRGIVLAENMGDSDLVGKDLNFREYVRETLRTGKPQLSAPFRLTTPPHTPMIAMTQPIRDDSDRIIAVVAGYHTLGTGGFLTALSSNDNEKSYRYMLHERTIVQHPDASRILEEVPEGKNRGIDQTLTGFEGSLDNVNSKGQHMLSSFKRIGESRLILAANTPYDIAFSQLRQLNYLTILVAGFGVLAASLLLWAVTRRLTQPIRELTAHVDRGVTWQPLELHTGDEIQTLSEAFDDLMVRISESRHDLEENAVKSQELAQKLAEENTFITGVLNSIAAPLFVLGRDHRVLFWNRSLERLTGLPAAEMLGTGRHWQAFYPQERPTLADMVIDNSCNDMQRLYAKYNRSKYIKDGWSAEGWYDLAGSARYLIFDVAPVINSQGEIIAAVETFEDETAQVRLEDNLRKLLRAVEQSPATIVITDVQGAIEYVNPKFVETTGYSVEEALGNNPRILKSGELSPDAYASLWKSIQSGQEWRGEFHNRRKDGTLYWEYASISPLYDKNGVITNYLAVKEDITERKNVENQLAMAFEQVTEAKREWETTLDCLHDIIILADSAHCIRRCNRFFTEISGMDYSRLLGRNCFEMLGESGFTIVSLKGGKGELRHERSLRTYDLDLYEIHHPETGLVTGTVFSLNDTTELRSLTNDLKQALEELEHAQMQIFQQEKLASIGQLAAGVAHEINNPMGFINSNLGTLTKYIDRLTEYIAAAEQAMSAGSDNQEGRQQLQELRRRLKIDHVLDDARQLISESQDGAGRVRRIVQDLKSFSRVDQTECAYINMNEALDTTINIAWNEIKYVAGLEREFGEVPEIRCHPQQINQVFLNLLVNSAHAMEEGRQGLITVRSWSDGDSMFVSVADNGRGIPEENLTKIFEPFFTTKEVGKGTGLGLSISYDIIRKHGGEITVESRVGVGTTFTVRLPVAGPPADSVQEESV